MQLEASIFADVKQAQTYNGGHFNVFIIHVKTIVQF